MSKDWSVFAYVGRAISDLENSEALRTNWATLLDLTLQVSSAVRPLIDDGTPLTDLRIASLHLDYTVQFLRKMPELARSTRYLEILSAELRNATFGAEITAFHRRCEAKGTAADARRGEASCSDNNNWS